MRYQNHAATILAVMLSYLASGMSEQEILDDFPDLEREDFVAVYQWAAEMARKQAG